MMNATMNIHESIVADLNANDEAALVNSFFLPGGILDPDQEEEEAEAEERENPRNATYLPVAYAPPVTTSATFQWTNVPPLVTQHRMPCEPAAPNEMTEEFAASNSFWSNAAS